MQLWPHKCDWWWSQHKRMFRYKAVPPAIEMRVLTERKFVEQLLFVDFSHLIIHNKYTICYKSCLQNSKKKIICLFWWILIWAKDLILFYWEYYESQNYREYRQLNATLIFVHLISRLHILFCMTSPICVRRYYYFTKVWVAFQMFWKLCQ